jgi:thiamine-phosphate pyrophosphorylase
MKIVVISPSKSVDNEPKIVTELFEHGLETFHLRKPSMRTKEMKNYITEIPAHFHNRIIIHSHHNLARKFNLKGIHLTRQHHKKRIRTWFRLRILKLRRPNLFITTSFHKLASIYRNEQQYHHVFLGTIFDQVSEKFNAGFNETSLRAALEKTDLEVIARGGTTKDNIALCNALGFSGMAFYSGVWKKEDPLEAFRAIVAQFRELNIKTE